MNVADPVVPVKSLVPIVVPSAVAGTGLLESQVSEPTAHESDWLVQFLMQVAPDCTTHTGELLGLVGMQSKVAFPLYPDAVLPSAWVLLALPELAEDEQVLPLAVQLTAPAGHTGAVEQSALEGTSDSVPLDPSQ